VAKIIYYVATSLDGYIATPDGGVAWLSSFENSEEDYGYKEFYGSVDALIFGSKTYEKTLTLGEWPYPNKPCWVFSKRSIQINQPEVNLISQGLSDFLKEILKRKLRRVWLVGGGKLAASFKAEGLITEYIISIIPVLLGGGVPLFGSPGPMEKLERVEYKSYPNGVVQLRYSRGADF